MVLSNARLSEQLSLQATIDPVVQVSGTVLTSDYIDLSNFRRAIFIALSGDMASETIDFAVMEATNASAGSAQVLKSATQWVAHATGNDDKQLVVNVRSEELSAGYTHVALRWTQGSTVGGPGSVVGLGADPRHVADETGDDLATVKEIVT